MTRINAKMVKWLRNWLSPQMSLKDISRTLSPLHSSWLQWSLKSPSGEPWEETSGHLPFRIVITHALRWHRSPGSPAEVWMLLILGLLTWISSFCLTYVCPHKRSGLSCQCCPMQWVFADTHSHTQTRLGNRTQKPAMSVYPSYIIIGYLYGVM